MKRHFTFDCNFPNADGKEVHAARIGVRAESEELAKARALRLAEMMKSQMNARGLLGREGQT